MMVVGKHKLDIGWFYNNLSLPRTAFYKGEYFMVYTIVASAFSQFFLKLLGAMISENMLKSIFFYCARRLAKYTDTPIDDQFVEKLYKEFNNAQDPTINTDTDSH